MTRSTVFNRAVAAGIGCHIAADKTGIPAAGVACIKGSLSFSRSLQIRGAHTRLYNCVHSIGINLDNFIHLFERKHYTAVNGHCTAGKTCACAAWHNREDIFIRQFDHSCHLLCVQLTGQASTQFLNGLRELPYLAKGETCPAAAELMGRLAEEKPTHSRARSQLVFALLCELADADSAAPPLPPLVQAAIEDIRANYAGLYGVEELSERLGVSKSHLVRTFTAAVGVPPGKYLTTVRIEAAQRLLLHREYTLDVVASLCGFSGANYLCRVFKKETGQSPAQWRALTGRAAQSGLTPEETMREQEMYI